MISPRRN